MSTQDLIQDPNSVDVSPSETHNQVQCVEVRLLSSQLQPLKKHDEDLAASRFLFKIEGIVEGDTAFSNLHVQVILVNPEDATGYELHFILLGIFVSEETIQPEVLADFVRMYTLSILWPYAREYTSDQFRRAGQPFDSLPIINPQVVTQNMIDANRVNVKFRAGEEKTPAD